MQTTQSSATASTVTHYPTLQALGLDDVELRLLRRQGYVQCKTRFAIHRKTWRLRFRLAGRTRTVCLGSDERVVARVRHELAMLQDIRHRRQRLAKAAKELLREAISSAKLRATPILRDLEMHYHGDAIRQARHRTASSRRGEPKNN
jgi:hypothetical protein